MGSGGPLRIMGIHMSHGVGCHIPIGRQDPSVVCRKCQLPISTSPPVPRKVLSASLLPWEEVRAQVLAGSQVLSMQTPTGHQEPSLKQADLGHEAKHF